MRAWKKSFFGVAVLWVCLAGSLSGCSRNSQPYDPYYWAWYDAFGHACGFDQNPVAGCTYHSWGARAEAWEDRYWYLRPQNMQAFEQWWSPSGVIYDAWGWAVNAQNDAGRGRDLMSDVGSEEDRLAEVAASHLRAKYLDASGLPALSEETALRITRGLQEWTLLSARPMQEADVRAFTERFYGVPFAKIAPALKAAQAGEVKLAEDLNGEIAASWGTSPETSKTLLLHWYWQEAGAAPAASR